MNSRYLALLFASLSLLPSSHVHADDEPKLFPITTWKDGDWMKPQFGFIDQSGAVVIPPTSDLMEAHDRDVRRIGLFKEGLLPVEVRSGPKGFLSGFGYIDAKGQVAIAPQFSLARSFAEGLGLVRGDKGYGYIDHAGKYVIPSQFAQAEPFSCGLASVWVTNQKHGFIDHTGKLVISFDDPNVYGSSFSEDLARTLRRIPQAPGNPADGGEEMFGYCDKAGNPITDFKFKVAEDFHEGLAAVSDGDGYGYIDKTGAFAFPTRFFMAWEFSEGMARVQMKGGKMAYIDHKGNIVSSPPPNITWADPFSEGLAMVRTGWSKKNSCGYIDHTGALVIPLQFYEATPFANGLARVFDGKRTGYIDKTGKFVWTEDMPKSPFFPPQ